MRNLRVGSSGRSLLTCVALVLVAAVAVATVEAAQPRPGATYTGTSTAVRFATVKLKVSPNGHRVDWRGPHEYCGTFNPLPPYFGRINGLKISSEGKFQGKREYTLRRPAARRGPTGDLDQVLDWTVSVTGRFVSPSKARGKTTYRLRHHLEDSDTHEHYPPGGHDEVDCGKRSGSWSAKR